MMDGGDIFYTCDESESDYDDDCQTSLVNKKAPLKHIRSASYHLARNIRRHKPDAGPWSRESSNSIGNRGTNVHRPVTGDDPMKPYVSRSRFEGDGSDSEKPRPQRVLPACGNPASGLPSSHARPLSNARQASALRDQHESYFTKLPAANSFGFSLKNKNKSRWATSTPTLLPEAVDMCQNNLAYKSDRPDNTERFIKKKMAKVKLSCDEQAFLDGRTSPIEGFRTSDAGSPVNHFNLSSISLVDTSSVQDFMVDMTLVAESPKVTSNHHVAYPMNSTVAPSGAKTDNSSIDYRRVAPINSTMMPMHSTAISQLESSSSSRQSNQLPRRLSPIGRSHSLLTEELMVHAVSPVKRNAELSIDCWDVYPEISTATGTGRRSRSTARAPSARPTPARPQRKRSLSNSTPSKTTYRTGSTARESTRDRKSEQQQQRFTSSSRRAEIHESTPPDGQSLPCEQYYSNRAPADPMLHLQQYDSHLIGQMPDTSDSLAVHTSFTTNNTTSSQPSATISSKNLSSLRALSPTERTTVWLSGSQYLHLAPGPITNWTDGREAMDPRSYPFPGHSVTPRQPTNKPPRPPKRHNRVQTLITETLHSVQNWCSDSDTSESNHPERIDLLSDFDTGIEQTQRVGQTTGVRGRQNKYQTPKRSVRFRHNSESTIHRSPDVHVQSESPVAHDDTLVSNNSVHQNRFFPCLPKRKDSKYAKHKKMTLAAAKSQKNPLTTLCVL